MLARPVGLPTSPLALAFNLPAEVVMKDPYQVLRQKEMDIARVRKDIEALHLAIPLLAEEEGDLVEYGRPLPPSQLRGTGTADPKGWP